MSGSKITCWSTFHMMCSHGESSKLRQSSFPLLIKPVLGYWKGWHAARVMALNGEWEDVTLGKKGSGHGLKYNSDDVAQAVHEISLRHRSTCWLLEGALAISKGTIHCLIRTEKILRSHSNVWKPMLTEEDKLHILEFVSMREPTMVYSRRCTIAFMSAKSSFF
jgi:hypothetical protein